MEQRILVPMTHAEESEKALEFALSKFPDAEITVVHVLAPSEHYAIEGHIAYEKIINEEQEKANELFQRATEIASDHGTTIRTEILSGEVSMTILEYVDEHDVDQLILGSRGRGGVSRLLLGSVAETVARRSPVPVTIVR